MRSIQINRSKSDKLTTEKTMAVKKKIIKKKKKKLLRSKDLSQKMKRKTKPFISQAKKSRILEDIHSIVLTLKNEVIKSIIDLKAFNKRLRESR